MADQILWLNALAAITPGVLLLVVPGSTARVLGLPRSEQSFYPRLLGIVMLSVAAALFAEGRGYDGLGIQGAVAMNLTAAGMLALLLMFGGLVIAKRGRWVLRGAVVTLGCLGVAGWLAS